MNFLESLLVALDGLRSNKMRSGLTMLGVIIGVFSVIILVSVGQGVKNQVTEQVQQFGPNLIMVLAGNFDVNSGTPSSSAISFKYEDAQFLESKMQSVKGVAPSIETPGHIEYGNEEGNLVVEGVTANYPKIVSSFAPARGRFFSEAQVASGRRVVAIGESVRKDIFGSENPIGKTVKIGDRRFKVVAVMKPLGRMFGMDVDRTAFMPITTAADVFGGDKIEAMMVLPKDGQSVPRVVAEIERVMAQRFKEDEFTVMTMGQMVNTFQNILNIMTGVLGGIAAISLLVGGIGIMNIMLVSVTERTREIGIRKAVGARRVDIMTQFIIESVVLSLAGGLTGILLGAGVSALINQLTTSLPSSITPWSVALAFFFSAAVGIFFGVYPAWKAARLNPIDALRYE